MGQSGLEKSFRAYIQKKPSSNKEEEQVKGELEDNLGYYYPEYFEADAKAQVPLFEDETGISVTGEQTPANTTGTRGIYADILESEGSSFDVGHMDIAWAKEFINKNWCSTISDRESRADSMIETQVEMVTIDEELRAMPLHSDANVLYYRADKLEQHGYESPPETDRELVEIAQDILANDSEIKHGFIWQGEKNEGLTIMWLNWMWGRGGELYNGEEIVVNTSAGVNALRHAVDLIYVHDITPSLVTKVSTGEARQIFQRGNTLFMRNWPYAASRLNEGTPVADDFSVTTLTTHSDHRGTRNSCLGGWNLFINPYSKNNTKAQEFVEWMTSKPVQRRLAMDHSRLPVRADLYNDPDVRTEFPFINVFESALNNARVRPSIKDYPRLSEIIFSECSAAIKQEKTPASALSDAQKKINEEINNN